MSLFGTGAPLTSEEEWFAMQANPFAKPRRPTLSPFDSQTDPALGELGNTTTLGMMDQILQANGMQGVFGGQNYSQEAESKALRPNTGSTDRFYMRQDLRRAYDSTRKHGGSGDPVLRRALRINASASESPENNSASDEVRAEFGFGATAQDTSAGVRDELFGGRSKEIRDERIRKRGGKIF